MLHYFGVTKEIISDHGGEFNHLVFVDHSKDSRIRHIKNSYIDLKFQTQAKIG